MNVGFLKLKKSIRKMFSDDSGQVSINSFPQIILIIGVSGLLLGLMMLVVSGFAATQVTSFAVINNTPGGQSQAANTFAINFTTFGSAQTLGNNPANVTNWIRIVNSSVVLTNQTSRFTAATDGFHVEETAGTIFIVNRGPINISTSGIDAETGLLNVSYTYQFGNDARNLFIQVNNAYTQIGNFFGILGVVAISAIIVGMVMTVFAVGFILSQKQQGGQL